MVKFQIIWNLNEEKNNPEIFAQQFVEQMEKYFETPEMKERARINIVNDIYSQLIENICKLNKIPKFKICKIHEGNAVQNPLKMNDICEHCGYIKYNNEYCINCT
mgnify:CR=1 FL=1